VEAFWEEEATLSRLSSLVEAASWVVEVSTKITAGTKILEVDLEEARVI
jgi:hypothetical protein